MLKPILSIIVFLISCISNAIDVRMAFGEKIPPFCFPETNSGIEVEIIQEALAYKGHKMIPVYYPFARIPLAFKDKHVDGAMTDLGENLEKEGGFYAEPGIFYDNVFITLKERNISISKPQDLKGLRVVSFHGALARYGDWLGEVDAAKKLKSENNQENQVLLLNKNRYDVVLSDRNIYKYFHNQLKLAGKEVKPYQEHSFVKLNPMDYRAVFRDAQIRDDYNAGLKFLKSTGRFDAIYDKYLGDHPAPKVPKKKSKD